MIVRINESERRERAHREIRLHFIDARRWSFISRHVTYPPRKVRAAEFRWITLLLRFVKLLVDNFPPIPIAYNAMQFLGVIQLQNTLSKQRISTFRHYKSVVSIEHFVANIVKRITQLAIVV